MFSCEYKVDFDFFWEEYLNYEYKPVGNHRFWGQYFNLEHVLPIGTQQMYFDISMCFNQLSTIRNKTIRFSQNDFYYTDMSKYPKSQISKLILSRHIGEYPIMAVYLPISSGQNYAIIEGNHRVTNALVSHSEIDVLCFDSILLTPDMFTHMYNWLKYIMLANYYQITHNEPNQTSFFEIASFLDKYKT